MLVFQSYKQHIIIFSYYNQKSFFELVEFNFYMPVPSFCSLEDAWGKDYDPNAPDTNPIKPLRTLSNKETVNTRNMPANNPQNNEEHNMNSAKSLGIYQHPSNMNVSKNENNLLYESATQNYFKDRREYEPYQEADYKSGCAPRHPNPMFPHENEQKVIEPNDRKYFSRTMAPLKDTQGPQNRYFSNPLIQNLRREQKTRQNNNNGNNNNGHNNRHNNGNNRNNNNSNRPNGLFENGGGGYFPISELGHESNYFTKAMKNLVQSEKKQNEPATPYNFNNGAYMNLNQRENHNVLQNRNVRNANRTEKLMDVNKNNGNNGNRNNGNVVESFSNMETYINYLQQNNDLLRQQVELLQQNSNKPTVVEDRSPKMYVFDLLLYIVSGIFIIYILDLFVKMLLKNKKN